MSPVSSAVAEKSRKYQSLVLQKVSSAGQNRIAEQLDTSEATVSRVINADLERVIQLLAVLDLKVVPAEMMCFPPRKIAILMELARDHLNQLESPEQLTFD